MAFILPPLPYASDALAPHLSQETLELHHGKHHQSYVTKLNELTGGERSNDELEAVILDAAPGGLFNNAAQHWNHTFYWRSMAPTGGGVPEGALADALAEAFGSVDAFSKELNDTAVTHFGSGWAWLVHDGSRLQVAHTSDADLPLKHGQHALLTIDVWEHAYYVDYRNKRPDYVSAFLDHLVNWDFVAENLAQI
jgi:superoxide dismutase, Fe-Mn family